jgi:signal transduction histidine kinase
MAIAILQYQWIGRVADAELEHRKAGLTAGLLRVRRAVNREVTRAHAMFQGGPHSPASAAWDGYAAGRFDLWQSRAVYPDLIARICVAKWNAEPEFACFDPREHRLIAASWPAAYGTLRAALSGPTGRPMLLKGFGPPAFFSGVEPGDNPLVVAETDPVHDSHTRPPGWWIVELNRDIIARRILPELMRRHLEGPSNFDFQVVPADAPSTKPADASTSLVEVGLEYREPGDAVPGSTFVAMRTLAARGEVADAREGYGIWRLKVRHREGSLDAAAANLRRMHVFGGEMLLALLAAAVCLTVLWAKRVSALGRMKMQFAASVTHELRTPLASIHTAADNLARGVVTNDLAVREYGEGIRRESRRLSQSIEQILTFSARTRKPYRLEAVDPAAVIRRATAAVDAERRERGCTIDCSIDEGLPSARADESALAECLVNLLRNAIKHGDEGGRIEIRARGGAEIALSVEDEGPGIGPRDLPRVFEPFYQGSRNGGGAGLGLSIVKEMMEAQGGRVTVESSPGWGSRFTLHVPRAE